VNKDLEWNTCCYQTLYDIHENPVLQPTAENNERKVCEMRRFGDSVLVRSHDVLLKRRFSFCRLIEFGSGWEDAIHIEGNNSAARVKWPVRNVLLVTTGLSAKLVVIACESASHSSFSYMSSIASSLFPFPLPSPLPLWFLLIWSTRFFNSHSLRI